MTDIGKGDWVECIDDSPDYHTGNSALIKGAMYHVTDVFTLQQYECQSGCGLRDTVQIAGSPKIWCVHRFHLLKRRDEQMLRDLHVNDEARLGAEISELVEMLTDAEVDKFLEVLASTEVNRLPEALTAAGLMGAINNAGFRFASAP